MSNLTPEAEHEMDLIRRRSKAYGESINPKQPSLDEMVAKMVANQETRVTYWSVDYPNSGVSGAQIAKEKEHLLALVALQDVLGLPKKDDCPIEGCTNKYEAGEVAGYNQALDDLRQAISSRLGVE